MSKLDYLGECNDQNLPLEDFRVTFCVRCFQQECTRSQFGLSRFEARVATWRDRLFAAPQLPKNDPRYTGIISKKFVALPIVSGSIQTRQEWLDPQTLDTPALPAQIASVSPVVVEVKAPEPPPPLVVEPPQPPVVETKTEPARPRPNLFMNTPYTGPRTLDNRPPETQQPAKDPWAVPGTESSKRAGEKVVAPGARVKIGGTG